LIKHLIKPEYTALFGQTVKEVAAPPKATVVTPRTNNTLSYLKEYQGQYPSQVGLFENEELPRRMKNLMGTASFAKFIGYAQKENPIQFYNGLALVTGCKQNDCERYESVVFINTGLDKVYIGLLDNDQVQTWSDHPTFKSYDPNSMPADFKAWFLNASEKARERRGTGEKKEERPLAERTSRLTGANSPEELAKVLLQALKTNDAKTWMRYMHPDNEKEDDELSMRRFVLHRECLSQRGISNWPSIIYSRMMYSILNRDDSSIFVNVEFTYQNKEFFGRIPLGTFLRQEGKWLVWFSGYPDMCQLTRYQRN
jgi:hypothetical protein